MGALGAIGLLGACSQQDQEADAVAPVEPAYSMQWAFPGRGGPPPSGAPVGSVTLADGSMTLPRAATRDPFAAPDWRPESHPPAPTVVMRGRRPAVRACAFCHMPNGVGAPGTAPLAGLPAAFIRDQLLAMQRGTRKPMGRGWLPSIHMHEVAVAMLPDEIDAAAEYYSRLPFRSRSKVVERELIPPYREQQYHYSVSQAKPSVPLVDRIVETPTDLHGFSIRDPETSYVAYVPAGAIGRGKRLASRADAGHQPCASCHGPALEGGSGPPIAGRYPTSIARQLVAYRERVTGGEQAAIMTQIASTLSDRDIVDVAAYVGSLSSVREVARKED